MRGGKRGAQGGGEVGYAGCGRKRGPGPAGPGTFNQWDIRTPIW